MMEPEYKPASWLQRLTAKFRPELQVTPSRNETFRHVAGCRKPARPCGCMPVFLQDETVREFWVTDAPNRSLRRWWASPAFRRLRVSGGK